MDSDKIAEGGGSPFNPSKFLFEDFILQHLGTALFLIGSVCLVIVGIWRYRSGEIGQAMLFILAGPLALRLSLEIVIAPMRINENLIAIRKKLEQQGDNK